MMMTPPWHDRRLYVESLGPSGPGLSHCPGPDNPATGRASGALAGFEGFGGHPR